MVVYVRAVRLDGRIRQGLSLVVDVYCPEKRPDIEDFFEGWSSTMSSATSGAAVSTDALRERVSGLMPQAWDDLSWPVC